MRPMPQPLALAVRRPPLLPALGTHPSIHPPGTCRGAAVPVLRAQGYVVVALEHADGTASVARLPQPPRHAAVTAPAAAAVAAATTRAAGGSCPGSTCAEPAPAPDSDHVAEASAADAAADANSATASAAAAEGTNSSSMTGSPPIITTDLLGRRWRWYGGMGDKAAQIAKTSYRVLEVNAAYHLLQKLDDGAVLEKAAPQRLSLAVRRCCARVCMHVGNAAHGRLAAARWPVGDCSWVLLCDRQSLARQQLLQPHAWRCA